MSKAILEKGLIQLNEDNEMIKMNGDQCNHPCPYCTTSYNNCVLTPLHWGSHRCANGHTY